MRTAIFRSPRGTRAVHCGCARRPFPAKRRPQFISVTVSGARFWERSTLFNRFNLCENCYISVAARDARCALRVSKRPLPAERRPQFISVTAWEAGCSLRVSKRPLPAERRPKFISVATWEVRCSLRLSRECSTLPEWYHATRSTIFAARVAPASNSSNAAGPAASGRSSSQSPSSETRPSASSASARAKSASL